MNIFVLDEHPDIAASYLCDKHLSKMLLESCQLMCTAKNILEPNNVFQGQYKSTHINHPCSIWTRQSYFNCVWLYSHAKEISKQYTETYGKIHKCQNILNQLGSWLDSDRVYCLFEATNETEHPQCMPDEYKDISTVRAYRNYYFGDKARFAKWKNRPVPFWWKEKENE